MRERVRRSGSEVRWRRSKHTHLESMNVAERTFNILSLCSGGGGLELGLELALGCTRAIAHVEREAYAVEYLASQMDQGILASAPIYSDLRTFKGRPWRGVVDCVTAGYPCQ